MASSSLNSSTSSQSQCSSNVIEEDETRKYYLPAVLANRKAAQVGSIDLHFTKYPHGRCMYTYTVEWNENIKEAAEKVQQESDFSEMLKLDRLDQLSKINSTLSNSNPSSSFIPTDASTPIKAPAPPLRRCDGPCWRRVNVEELSSMGLCEHVVCFRCLSTAPRIELTFGGLGCPNTKCYLLDVGSLCPDKRKRIETFRQAYALKSPVSSLCQSINSSGTGNRSTSCHCGSSNSSCDYGSTSSSATNRRAVAFAKKQRK